MSSTDGPGPPRPCKSTPTSSPVKDITFTVYFGQFGVCLSDLYVDQGWSELGSDFPSGTWSSLSLSRWGAHKEAGFTFKSDVDFVSVFEYASRVSIKPPHFSFYVIAYFTQIIVYYRHAGCVTTSGKSDCHAILLDTSIFGDFQGRKPTADRKPSLTAIRPLLWGWWLSRWSIGLYTATVWSDGIIVYV